MRRFPLAVALAPALSFAAAAPAVAQEPAPAALEDDVAYEGHVLELPGGAFEYESQAGTLVLREEDGTPRATVFHVAYVKADLDDDPEERAARPVTFCFNGGPGSSSVWLHLGAFGPKRVDLGPDGFRLTPPFRLVDNPHTVLDRTDLVFVDPVTTGYSRAAEGVDDSEFHGVDEDVESVGEFVRLWLSRNARWTSPVYLAGESYGTTRAARLARHLQERHGIYPSGAILVSAILNFATARFDVGNDLPHVLFLPTYAATAHYHGRLDEAQQARPLEAFLDEVRQFAQSEYASALMQGDALPGEERDAIAERVARYTGLSADYVRATNLRVHIGRFCKELRRDERLTVGRLDSRYTGRDLDAAGERYDFDPSYAAIEGPYSATLNQYVRTELGFESDLPYEILTGRVHPWSYDGLENRYLNVGEDLRRAMAVNPALRVYVANGYYDLATPFFATEYTFDHLFLEPEAKERVSMGWFESGHMMYVKVEELAALREDLAAFYAAGDVR